MIHAMMLHTTAGTMIQVMITVPRMTHTRSTSEILQEHDFTDIIANIFMHLIEKVAHFPSLNNQAVNRFS